MKFQALAFHQNDWRNCGLCVSLYTKNAAKLSVGIGRENKNKLFGKVFIDTAGIKSATLEDKFLFLSFVAFWTA